MGFIAAAAGAVAPDAALRPAAPLGLLLAFLGPDSLPGVDFFISDPVHHYMESGMLKGIKERAEGTLGVA